MNESQRPTNDQTVIIVFANLKYWRVLRNWLTSQPEENKPLIRLHLYGRWFAWAVTRFGYAVHYMRPKIESPEQLWRDRLEGVQSWLDQGYRVIMSDADAVPTQPYLEYLNQFEADLVSSQGTIFPPRVQAEWGFVLCCGFMVFSPTPQAQALIGLALASPEAPFTDQLAINTTLLEARLEWQSVEPDELLDVRGRTVKTFAQPLEGVVPSGSLAGLRAVLLPHREVKRWQLATPEQEPKVFHPLPPKPGASSVIATLKRNGLWRQ